MPEIFVPGHREILYVPLLRERPSNPHVGIGVSIYRGTFLLTPCVECLWQRNFVPGNDFLSNYFSLRLNFLAFHIELKFVWVARQ